MRQKYEPWHPITNTVTLKHLGKLAEECAELSAALARCIIQGVGECEPDTKKPNRQWLEEEIADVTANIRLVTRYLNLDTQKIGIRAFNKEAKLKVWHDQA